MYVKAPIPSEVYHLTKKANLESILDDGAIRRFGDTECWFCESLEKMKAYMERTVLCEGKAYYDVGGQLCHYPKFEPDRHVILKLKPCRREGNWYRWNQEIPPHSPPELVQAAVEFSKLKIGFRGDLPFRNAEAIDVAEFLHGSIVCRNVQTTSELWKRLSEKVEQNWQTYQRNLYDRSPGVLIGIADEIAATATCYSEFLCSGSDLSRRDLSYLLQFENPLDVLRDRWVLDQSTEQGTRFFGMLESLRSEGHAEQDYPLDEAYAQTQKNEMTMQLYMPNHHEGIVSREQYNAVKAEMARRSALRSPSKSAVTGRSCYTSKYALSDRLVCGECGTLYRRCIWTSLGRKYPVWRCTSRLNYGTKYCRDSPTIKEEPLQNAILSAINSAMSSKPALLDRIRNAVSVELLPVQGQTLSLADIERRLTQLDEQFQSLLAEAIDAEDKEACNAQFAEILAEQTALKKQKEAILQSSNDADRVCTRMKQAEQAIESTASTITEWNENAVRQIVERVTVLSADEILVRIKGGAEIKQRLEG